ncbi:hypothetical protein [Psychrobacter sp.]|uniref:hypothetical protein n=1 Tax=Psychrobacter sp. TaxID=56811 RepID=UPI0025D300F7|nr:hypothetical protein [Psychrobacter sp.]
MPQKRPFFKLTPDLISLLFISLSHSTGIYRFLQCIKDYSNDNSYTAINYAHLKTSIVSHANAG